YADYENTWFDIEDGIRGTSRTSYVAIEKAMTAVEAALEPAQADPAQVVDALAILDREQRAYLSGASTAASDVAPSEPSIGTLLDQLGEAQAALARGDYAAASGRLSTFESTWLDAEGQVKTRSADDYRQTETDMALAQSLVGQRSPEAASVVSRMAARLQPYQQEQRYGIFDASAILLREGMEALLVIVALSAVLKRSAARAGQAWLWAGAVAGVVLSIALGLAIQAFFGAVVTPTNRELLEGVVGLFAAAMLIYVSYWLHSKATLGGWQKYINRQTAQALEGGRLAGIGLLAFLAVFREGAETALFYLGMAPSISNVDLFIGLAIGLAVLVGLGFVILGLGVRVPMRPFFGIASVLVFYLCFKFIGTGIHALQIAGIVPSASTTYLPSVDVLGLYPTWQTTMAQGALLAVAAGFVLRGRLRRIRLSSVLASAAVLMLLGVACSVATPTSAPNPPAVPPAAALTSNRPEATLVAGPRRRLEDLATALQRQDVGSARAALDAYDAEWNGIEVYVNVRSRALYGEIESHYQADITSALQQPQPDTARILPL
ncbi:MAG TPA: FTR1 family protein, partial [Chloroflexota bacterium]